MEIFQSPPPSQQENGKFDMFVRKVVCIIQNFFFLSVHYWKCCINAEIVQTNLVCVNNNISQKQETMNNREVLGAFITCVISGRCEVDVGES